jgi:hypothetical protein
VGCKCSFPLADDGDEELEEYCHVHSQGHSSNELDSEQQMSDTEETLNDNDNMPVRDGQNPNLTLPHIIGHRGA